MSAQKLSNRVQVGVRGMTCRACETRVTNAIQRVPGVQSASVNLDTGRVEIRFTDDVAISAIRRAVEDAGYEFNDEAQA